MRYGPSRSDNFLMGLALAGLAALGFGLYHTGLWLWHHLQQWF
jgi:hypothetical protein